MFVLILKTVMIMMPITFDLVSHNSLERQRKLPV